MNSPFKKRTKVQSPQELLNVAPASFEFLPLTNYIFITLACISSLWYSYRLIVSDISRVLSTYIPHEWLLPLFIMIGVFFMARQAFLKQNCKIQKDVARPNNFCAMQSMPTPTKILRDPPMASLRTPAKDARPSVTHIFNDVTSIYGKFKTPSRAAQKIPNTGSPIVDASAEKRLPEWTEALRRPPEHIQKKKNENFAAAGNAEVSNKQEWKVSDEEHSLLLLGLYGKMDEIIEKSRRWFSDVILAPLNSDIDAVNGAFTQRGWDYLGPHVPASFSVSQSKNYMSNSIILTSTPSTTARPLSLHELSTKYPGDEMVQKRIKIERFLAFSSSTSNREYTIQRLKAMCSNDFFPGSQWNRIDHFANDANRDSDSKILMNLFCAFMDMNLACDKYFESSPFSSRHYSEIDGLDFSFDRILIQQIQDPHCRYRLIAEGQIYESRPGANNVYIVISLLVSYVHMFHNGYLGIGNLGTPSIRLLSILHE